MTERAAERKEEDGAPNAVKFANDGSFLEQFLAMQKQQEEGAAASSSDATVSKEEGRRPVEDGTDTVPTQDAITSQKSEKEVRKVVAPGSLGKSLISSFSTKPKKAPEQSKPASEEPETEEQTKKRKRDEYLAEMAKFRSSCCVDGDGKRPLVK